MHTATLLPNGKVLVAGGSNANGYISSAELYDPLTNSWTFTGNMNLSRAWHTATLLPDGTVLVVGGENGSVDLDLAELYDPATGHWSVLGQMNTARHGHTATLLPGGKVLITGGRSNNFIIDSAELYDSATNSWVTSDSLTNEREAHTATLMPNGQVLVAGGNGSNSQSVEVFDIGLDFQPLWQPVIDTVNLTLSPGDALEIGGSGFRGYGSTEASGSAANNSATNYPLVQLRSIDSGQTDWLTPDPNNPFSATNFTSLPVTNFPSGYAMATVFVNGIPSISKLTLIAPPGPSMYLPFVNK
ncbi:MAG: Kelch repeat-containing protein [Candidatus Promineifilaceae bacterium]